MKNALFSIFSIAALMTSAHAGNEPAPASTAEPTRIQSAPGRGNRRQESPFGGGSSSASIDPSAKGYTLVVSEFVTSREIMDEALSGKNPYEALRSAVKTGKADVRSCSGGGVLGGAPGMIRVSSQMPVISGTQNVSNGRTTASSSVTYREVGVSVDFSLASADGANSVAIIHYRSSGLLPGPVVDGTALPVAVSFQGEGSLKVESGTPTMLVSGESAGDESHRPHAVFVRADW